MASDEQGSVFAASADSVEDVPQHRASSPTQTANQSQLAPLSQTETSASAPSSIGPVDSSALPPATAPQKKSETANANTTDAAVNDPLAVAAAASIHLAGSTTAAHIPSPSPRPTSTMLRPTTPTTPRNRIDSAGSADILEHSRSTVAKLEKQGHRLVVDDKVFYKKTITDDIMTGIQLGIGHSVGNQTKMQTRDLLMSDFHEVLTINFPSSGSNLTPSHKLHDFRFKCYAPKAFTHFREHYGIKADDYMLALCTEKLKELSNPGASGSIFFMSQNDQFIIKTVQKKESDFLRKLLSGYYLHLTQSKSSQTLLPKFYGLYNYQTAFGSHIRFVVMNNLLPSDIKFNERFDLKGSLFNRFASEAEKAKRDPTFKDIDFLKRHPNGLKFPKATHEALTNTLLKDARVLESFQIMDFSLLVGIHILDESEIHQVRASYGNRMSYFEPTDQAMASPAPAIASSSTAVPGSPRPYRFQTILPVNVIQTASESSLSLEWKGGLLATTDNGEKCLVFLGIIDILQEYWLKKKLEHTLKAMLHPTQADTISVHRPGFYSSRFINFMRDHVIVLDEANKGKGQSRRNTRANRRSTPGLPGSSMTTLARHEDSTGGHSTSVTNVPQVVLQPPSATDSDQQLRTTSSAAALGDVYTSSLSIVEPISQVVSSPSQTVPAEVVTSTSTSQLQTVTPVSPVTAAAVSSSFPSPVNLAPITSAAGTTPANNTVAAATKKKVKSSDASAGSTWSFSKLFKVNKGSIPKALNVTDSGMVVGDYEVMGNVPMHVITANGVSSEV